MADKLLAIARVFRKNPTKAEYLLWRKLRSKQFEGLKFKRQVPLGKYVADFICFENKILIEVDGGQHVANAKDLERDVWFKKQGFRVLRFWNNEVLENMEGVLEVIKMSFNASEHVDEAIKK